MKIEMKVEKAKRIESVFCRSYNFCSGSLWIMAGLYIISPAILNTTMNSVNIIATIFLWVGAFSMTVWVIVYYAFIFRK